MKIKNLQQSFLGFQRGTSNHQHGGTQWGIFGAQQANCKGKMNKITTIRIKKERLYVHFMSSERVHKGSVSSGEGAHISES